MKNSNDFKPDQLKVKVEKFLYQSVHIFVV